MIKKVSLARKFFGSIFWILLGRGFKFVFSFLTLILITGNLTLNEFGIYQSLLSIIIAINAFFDIGLISTAVKFISQARTDKDKKRIITSIINLKILFVIGFIITGAVMKNIITVHPDYDTFFYLVLLGYSIQSMGILLNEIFRGLHKFKKYGMISPTINLLYLIFLTVLFTTSGDTTSVGLSFLSASIVYVVINYGVLRKGKLIYLRATGYKFRAIMGHALPIGLYNLVTTIYTNMDVLFLTFFLTASNVGIYKLGAELNQYLVYLAATVSLVMLPLLSEFKDKKEYVKIRRLSSSFVKTFSVLSLVIFICGSLFGRAFISYLFPAYIESFTIFVILMLKTAMFSSGAISDTLVITFDKQKFLPLFNGSLAVLSAVFLYFTLPAHGIIGAALAIVTSTAIVTLITFAYIDKISGLRLTRIFSIQFLLLIALVFSFFADIMLMLGLSILLFLSFIIFRNRILNETERGLIVRIINRIRLESKKLSS